MIQDNLKYVFESKISRTILQCGQRCSMQECNAFKYENTNNTCKLANLEFLENPGITLILL